MIRKRLFLVRLALLNTFKRRLRAGLAIGGIALSAGVMVLLFGINGGLHDLVTNQVSQSEARDVVTVNQRNIRQIKLDSEHVSAIKSISNVGEVEQLVGTVGDGIYHGITLSMPVYGVTKGYFGMSPSPVLGGSIDEQPAGSAIIVSQKVLEAFGIGKREAVGKKISLRLTIQSEYASKQEEDTKKLASQEFTVAGVVERGALPVAYVPLEVLTRAGVDSVSQLKVRVNDPGKMPAVRESVEQMGLQTTSLQDSIEQVNRIFSVIQRILMLFGVITLSITIFGTFNIVTITLLQETKQIGFLRIMGLRTADVGFLFVVQSVLLTSLGALMGVLGGLCAGFIANGIVSGVVSGEGITGAVYLFKVPIVAVLAILLLSVGVGWLIGLAPARRAVTINPLEELKS